MRQVEAFNRRRRELVKRYFDKLKTSPGLTLPARGDSGHSWHMFAPLLPLDKINITRAQFIAAMAARGIGVGIHYTAVPLLSFYRGMGYKDGDFPNAEKIGHRTVTLPLFPAMKLADVDRVCKACADILASARR